MQWITQLISNPFLITSLSSWFIAQVLKVILHAWINKKIIWERLIGDGGMPSGHSATVSSLAMMSGLVYGMDSFQFAMAAVFAIVVCHDATGVRQETGKQAVIINEMIELFEKAKLGEVSDEVVLKEFVGHTLPQVAAGICIGLANAGCMYYFFFR